MNNERRLQRADGKPWDLIVVGGGITGVAIAREAARAGLAILLLEQRDFAWGASSRSGKWVHGGLRYLKDGHPGLTWHSVREREKLLQELPGLIELQPMLWPLFHGKAGNEIMIRAGLWAYDLMAGKRRRRAISRQQIERDFPGIFAPGLKGALCFYEGQTDDARLTLRLLQEARLAGAVAHNYCEVLSLWKHAGRVQGVLVQAEGNAGRELVKAQQVIAATGAWADQLRSGVQHDPEQHLRPLRGSHLILDADRLPFNGTLILEHPRDGRPGFVTRFQGRVLVGNTDIDHDQSLAVDARVTAAETDYLLQTLQYYFPGYGISRNDIIATFSGVRPVVDSGQADPSKESRDHAVWEEDGLLTIAGGKLTTFRHIALDALARIDGRFPALRQLRRQQPLLEQACEPLNGDWPLSAQQRTRLSGRYGAQARELLARAAPPALSLIPGTETLWAELGWCAAHEDVRHLDDLLLRRTRIGLLLPKGGELLLPAIRQQVQFALSWSDERWQQEVQRYLTLWRNCYSVPGADTSVAGKAGAQPANRAAGNAANSTTESRHV